MKARTLPSPFPKIKSQRESDLAPTRLTRDDTSLQNTFSRGGLFVSREIFCSPEAPTPIGPYSQAIGATGALVFTSGQIPIDPASGEVVVGDIRAQTHCVFKNLRAVLEAANTTMDRVVKVNVFLRDMEDFPIVNEVYQEHIPGDATPARTTLQVARLPKDVGVEIDMIALA